MTGDIFGVLFGFIVLKPLSNWLPETFPVLGGYFGPKENSIVMTAAMTSGGLAFLFISGVPALYQMGLLGAGPIQDYWSLVIFTLIAGYYGMLFTIPMANFFLVTLARELKIIFPSSTALAFAMQSLHSSAAKAHETKKKGHMLYWFFLGAFTLRVVSQYAPGILWDWHVFTWLYIWTNFSNPALMAAEGWCWFFEFSPAFTAIGILVGTNVAFSALFGMVLAWGILGPATVAAGVTGGTYPYQGTKWADYPVYMTLSAGTEPGTLPSPRYWIMWPGIMLMLCASITDFAVELPRVYQTVKLSVRLLRERRAAVASSSEPKPTLRLRLARMFGTSDDVQDGDLTWWMWVPATVIFVVVTCVVYKLQWDIGVGPTLVVLLLAFIFAIVAIQCAGPTDITPGAAIGKVIQLVMGGMVNQSNHNTAVAHRLNIIGGTMGSASAVAATELLMDLRIGFLVGTPRPQQLLTQVLGTMVAVFLSPLMFSLYASAYPCILQLGVQDCPFLVPNAPAYVGVAIVSTSNSFPIPTSSAYCSLGFGIFAVIISLTKKYYLTGHRGKYREWVPNFAIVGTMMLLPLPAIGICFAVGGLISINWRKRNLAGFQNYAYHVAAGMMVGEGFGGVINAIFQLAGIGGAVHGTDIACPLDSC